MTTIHHEWLRRLREEREAHQLFTVYKEEPEAPEPGKWDVGVIGFLMVAAVAIALGAYCYGK